MKIFGTGIDIVDVNRFRTSMKKNLNFEKRIFSKKEIIYCKKKTNYINCFAKRFAAKEAFSKSLGIGISKGLKFNEIIIINDKNGKPYIKLTGKTLNTVNKLIKKKDIDIFLSLSDEKKFAIAFVTIQI